MTWTTISLKEVTKEEIDEFRADGESWDSFLVRLISEKDMQKPNEVELSSEQLETAIKTVIEDIGFEDYVHDTKPTELDIPQEKIESAFKSALESSDIKIAPETNSDESIENTDVIHTELMKILELAEQTRNQTDEIATILSDFR